MTTRRTEDVIVDLASELAPVTPLASPSSRGLRWAWLAALAIVIGAAAIGVREDLLHVLRDVAWSTQLALTMAVAGAAGAAALRSSVPGLADRAQAWWLPAVALLGLSAFLGARHVSAGGTWAHLVHEPWHLACAARIAVLAVVPCLLLVRAVRRGAPLWPRSSASLSVLASVSLAGVAVQMVCPFDAASHILVAHVVPIVLLTVAAFAARRLVAK